MGTCRSVGPRGSASGGTFVCGGTSPGDSQSRHRGREGDRDPGLTSHLSLPTSHFQEFLLLRLAVPVDLGDPLVRQLLQAVLRTALVVVRDLLVVLQLAELLE